MNNLISIMTGKPLLKINKEAREIRTELTLVVGNLFRQSLFERKPAPTDKKIIHDRKLTQKYLNGTEKFNTKVFHCYGSDDRIYIDKIYRNFSNYKIFDRQTISDYHGSKKIVCVSGFFNEKENLNRSPYSFNDSYLKKVCEKTQWCDILCINSMMKDTQIYFSPELYNLAFQVKPKLIIIGGLKSTELVKYPLSDIPLLLIGKNSHIVYDLETLTLFKKLD